MQVVLKKERKGKEKCVSCWRARSLSCDSISPASATGLKSVRPKCSSPWPAHTVGEGQLSCEYYRLLGMSWELEEQGEGQGLGDK